jgi:predicted nuclease of predicted toxin-antitoxin system
MIVWIDAQISPSIATWMSESFSCRVIVLRDLGLRDANDRDIFFAARNAEAIIMSKDIDFVTLLQKYGAPPQLIWLRCGNTSNKQLKLTLQDHLKTAIRFLASGETIVEIRD